MDSLGPFFEVKIRAGTNRCVRSAGGPDAASTTFPSNVRAAWSDSAVGPSPVPPSILAAWLA